MKIKRKIKTDIHLWVIVVFFYIVISSLLAYFVTKYIELNREIDNLKKTQNVMVWYMDESCSNQIKNNSDGIIRLKIGE